MSFRIYKTIMDKTEERVKPYIEMCRNILTIFKQINQLISASDLDLLTSFDLSSLNISLCNITKLGTGDIHHQDMALCNLDMVKVRLGIFIIMTWHCVT